MKELGLQLRRQRESLGLDLDELQAKTKIRKRYLIALEEGDWSILPGDVYARGFVRSYAECVGLDGRSLLEQYGGGAEKGASGKGAEPPIRASKGKGTEVVGQERVTADAPSKDVELVSLQQFSEPKRKTAANSRVDNGRSKAVQARAKRRSVSARRSYAGAGQVAVVAGIFVLLGGGLWALNRNHTPPTKVPLNQGPGAPSNIAVTRSSGAGASGSKTGDAPVNLGVSGNAVTPGAKSGSSVGKVKPAPQVVVVAGPYDAAHGTQTYMVSTQDPLSVQMMVAAPCWVSVSADQKQTDPNDTINPGKPKTWQGTQSVDVFLGHVQNVQLSVNGKAVTLPNSNSPTHAIFRRSTAKTP